MELGRNSEGELGNGTVDDSYIPIKVTGLPRVSSIAAGYANSMALTEDGTIWAWGDNSYTQLGSIRENGEYPERIPGITNIKKITWGLGYGLGIMSDGKVWAWGWNKDTNLGIGSQQEYVSPTDVLGIDHVAEVHGESASIDALKSDGTVWEWGLEGPPKQVEGLKGVVQLNQGVGFHLAVERNGTVLTWGINDRGQLGDGTRNDRKTPVRISGLTNIIAVDGGEYHSIALQKDGILWTWGDNSYGQLGDGTSMNRNKPIRINVLRHMKENSRAKAAKMVQRG